MVPETYHTKRDIVKLLTTDQAVKREMATNPNLLDKPIIEHLNSLGNKVPKRKVLARWFRPMPEHYWNEQCEEF